VTEQNLCVISVDIGTSSVRACLVNDSLEIIHKSQFALCLETDLSGKAIQDAEEVLEKTLKCIKEAREWACENQLEVQGISFSNAVSSLVPLDRHLNPKGPIFTYADTRSHREARQLRDETKREIFQYTACPMHASYWLPKLLWLKKNIADLFNCHYFCTIKDLIIHRLSGKFVTDYSNAVATGLCDIRTKDWDDHLLSIAGIKKSQLPKVLPTWTIFKPGKQFQKDGNPVIVLGATDGVLSSLGAGAFEPGQVTTMIGSSGACRIASSSPLTTDKENIIWSYPLDKGIWIRGGAMNNGGLVMQWAANNFYKSNKSNLQEALELLLAQAAKVKPGSDGMIFLPYIYGERAPIWNEHARGVFFGIHADHGPSHFSRATLEGILYALYSIFVNIAADFENKDRIEVRASGGYIKSDLMLQMQADLFDVEVKIPANLEGSAIGAAALAFRAINLFSSYKEVSNRIVIKKTYKPNNDFVSIYRKGFNQFETLYSNLKSIMVEMGTEK